MWMKIIRDGYGVPAYRGARVRYQFNKDIKFGTIKSAKDGYINILLDGDKRTLPFHPTWSITYL